MAWIEVHQELRNHPKVIRLASILQCPIATALGYIVSLWLWAVSYARDGNLTKFSDAEIGHGANFDGDPKILVTALVEASLLDRTDLKLTLHDWKNYSLKFLNNEKRRVAKHRKTKELEDITVTLQLCDRNAYLTYLTNLTNQTNLTQSATLESELFSSIIGEWISYRRDKRKPLTQSMLTKQILWLDKQPDPVACLEQSMRNGWQGLFELKEKKNGKATHDIGRLARDYEKTYGDPAGGNSADVAEVNQSVSKH